MNKLTLFVLLIISVFTISANSQIILDENFGYPVGDTLGAHGWGFISSSVNPLTVASGNLTFSGYVNSNIGNYVRVRNNGQDEFTGFTAVTSGSIYFSFLINVDSSQASGDYFAALLPSTSTTNYTSRLYLRDTLSGFNLGLTKGAIATNPVTWSTTLYNRNVTYLVIIKYTFLTGTTTDDEIRGYVFNTAPPSTEPGTASIGPVTGPATDAPDIGRFALRQGSATLAPTLWFDGLRVCSSWSNIPTAITPIGTSVPVNYSLKQNYPNPFNPVTNIDFDVKKASFVTLKVYDVTGREVTTLVNNNLQAGTFRASFSANNYSSGVYYYKFIAIDNATGEKFINTKAMMLVK